MRLVICLLLCGAAVVCLPLVSASAAGNQAEFVSQVVPAQVAPGQSFAVAIAIKNTGTTTWTQGIFQLGAQKPTDNRNWGRSRIQLPVASVSPGQTVTFRFSPT